MEERDKEYHFVPCNCGKTLRLTISEKTYGREIITTCPSCNVEHRVTIPFPETSSDTIDTPCAEIKPYAEMLAEKLLAILEEAKDRKDIAGLRETFSEKGFGVEVVIGLAIFKNGDESEQKMSEVESDVDFLSKMNIRYN